jgi:hypothetical protein
MAQMMTNFTAADMPGSKVEKKTAPAPKTKAPKAEAPAIVEEVVAETSVVEEESTPVEE